MRLRWQNLNEDQRGRPKGLPFHGRAWLWLGEKELAHVEWNLWSTSFGASVSIDPSEDGLHLFAAVPPVAIYFSLPIFSGLARRVLETRLAAWWHDRTGGYKGANRYTAFTLASVRIFDWSLLWEFLKFDWGWSCQMPKWSSGSFRPGRLLGKWIYETKLIETRDIVVPMPEGEYPGSAELRWAVRGHRFSPLKHRNYEVEIKLARGIPHSGKGENSWNCGDDATYGVSGPARSIEDAIGKLVASTLETRRKRGDPAKWPTPPESEEVA